MNIVYLLLIVIAVVIGIAGILAYIFISVNNRLVALDARCDTAFSDIDAFLKHRQSMIPGLVETVRGFAGHERDILNNVLNARAAALSAKGQENRLDSEAVLNNSLNNLMNLAEAYPDLKASQHFCELRAEFVATENRITAARRFYNLAIEEYNATLRQFPGSLVGVWKRLGTRRPFDLGIERVMIDEPVAFKF